MLAGYRFEHPTTEVVVDVGGWSYVWAGLFGAFYVWHKGFGQLFWRAAAINLAYGLFFVAVWGATSMPQVPVQFQAAILLVLVPVLVLAQGNTMIRMIRDGYRRRGWIVRPG